jgi:hypothetical protein
LVPTIDSLISSLLITLFIVVFEIAFYHLAINKTIEEGASGSIRNIPKIYINFIQELNKINSYKNLPDYQKTTFRFFLLYTICYD